MHVTINSEGTRARATLAPRAAAAGRPGATVVIAASTPTRPTGPTRRATPTPTPTATPTPDRRRRARSAARPRKADAEAPTGEPQDVFPVYGGARVADDFGAPAPRSAPTRATTSSRPFGAPVLAVADGTLEGRHAADQRQPPVAATTARGDSFFYAHLSRVLARRRQRPQVKAGTVLGFVGNTGDAEPTPPHVHFEIHPDDKDAVDPHAILLAWQEQRPRARRRLAGRYGSDTAARPGALVEVRDFIAGE